MAGALGAGAFLGLRSTDVALALEASGMKLIWLRGAGCGGCTASLLNGGNPEVITALGKISLELAYHDGLMAQQGIFVNDAPAGTGKYNSNVRLDDIIAKEKYVLIMEGAIPNGPQGSGKYHMVAGKPLKDIFRQAASGAERIVAIGTCASYGGISRASGQKSCDARGVAYLGASGRGGMLDEVGVSKEVINVPGCPTHPDWVLLTLADVALGNEVALDRYARPSAFFGDRPLHDSCLRRGSYDRMERSGGFADEKCTYNQGCKGQLAFADCPTRRWNGGVNMCTQAGGLCIACTEPEFPDAFSPFFKRTEDKSLISGIDLDTGAKVILGAAAVGTGLHAVKRLVIGEKDNDLIEFPKDDKKRRI